jgi:hypothetical protein
MPANVLAAFCGEHDATDHNGDSDPLTVGPVRMLEED